MSDQTEFKPTTVGDAQQQQQYPHHSMEQTQPSCPVIHPRGPLHRRLERRHSSTGSPLQDLARTLFQPSEQQATQKRRSYLDLRDLVRDPTPRTSNPAEALRRRSSVIAPQSSDSLKRSQPPQRLGPLSDSAPGSGIRLDLDHHFAANELPNLHLQKVHTDGRLRHSRSSVFGMTNNLPVLSSQVGRVNSGHVGVVKPRSNSTMYPADTTNAQPPALRSRRYSAVSQAAAVAATVKDRLSFMSDGHGDVGEDVAADPTSQRINPGVFKNKRTGMSRRKQNAVQHITDYPGKDASGASSKPDKGTGTRDSTKPRVSRPLFVTSAPAIVSSDASDEDDDDAGDFEMVRLAERRVNMTESGKVLGALAELSVSNIHDPEQGESQAWSIAKTSFPDDGAFIATSCADCNGAVELTTNQARLLYLIFLYTGHAKEDADEWIRLMPLMVLVYEGLLDGLFDYNYSPTPLWLHGRRLYLNLSHEGFADIDFLRSAGIIKALKITSETYMHSTAFRPGDIGSFIVKGKLSNADKAAVNRFASVKLSRNTATGKLRRELLRVAWDPTYQCFHLLGSISGISLRSTITDVEALSYVMSPYLSQHLKTFEWPTGSLADRLPELIDATQHEEHAPDFLAITMDSVRLLLAEWVPMGGNAIVALNDRLGVSERVQGGFFTAAVDSHPAATLFKGGRQGLTSVRPLDYDVYSHVNFEAEVFYPTDPGVVQLEYFSVHCAEDGDVIFGGILEGTTGCLKDAISIDVVSRLLVDICMDSSKVVSGLFDSHQTDMLTCVMMEEPDHRDKFNCVLASKIQPRLTSDEVLAKGWAENKVKQVVGDIKIAKNIGDHLLVTGRDGLLLTGPKSRIMEPSILLFAKCHARSIFLKSIFSRCYIVVDILNQAHVLLQVWLGPLYHASYLALVSPRV
mmetsp:Transcript_38647/g.109295  ORF Transcript_38647/g.109295 Transcript_38647/m.109295 type:complete len:913 (+) Transcript_38647:295-3033(+)